MSTQQPDKQQLVEELKQIRYRRSERQRMNRRPRYRRSTLAQYRAEIVQLRQSGASLAEIQEWLSQRRTKANRSTISRFLKKLPELEE